MKKVLIGILAIIIVLVIGILLFRSCDIKTKNDVSNERSGFINANIDFTCYLYKNPQSFNEAATFDQVLYDTYARYSLPVDSDEEMIAILDRYETDAEVESIIKTNSAACKEGGEPGFID